MNKKLQLLVQAQGLISLGMARLAWFGFGSAMLIILFFVACLISCF